MKLTQQDEYLLGSLQMRDVAACDSFVDAQISGVYSWFYWLTGDSALAADLTQETFLAFWQSLDKGNAQTPARVWLLSVGRNIWRTACRAKSRRHLQRIDLGDKTADESTPIDALSRSECADAVRHAVAGLPNDFRESVTLRYWQDLTYQQIAEILGISVELARWRVFKARELLRAQLSKWAPEGETHDCTSR
jgi:RNA polymerase sigma-70 factor (ECF subfamily)